MKAFFVETLLSKCCHRNFEERITERKSNLGVDKKEEKKYHTMKPKKKKKKEYNNRRKE
jgi:hypothetical protein